MTNKELQNILKQYPDDATVWIIDRKNDMTLIVAALFFVLDMNYSWARTVNEVCYGWSKMVIKWERRHCNAIYKGVKDAVADLNRQILERNQNNDR